MNPLPALLLGLHDVTLGHLGFGHAGLERLRPTAPGSSFSRRLAVAVFVAGGAALFGFFGGPAVLAPVVASHLALAALARRCTGPRDDRPALLWLLGAGTAQGLAVLALLGWTGGDAARAEPLRAWLDAALGLGLQAARPDGIGFAVLAHGWAAVALAVAVGRLQDRRAVDEERQAAAAARAARLRRLLGPTVPAGPDRDDHPGDGGAGPGAVGR